MLCDRSNLIGGCIRLIAMDSSIASKVQVSIRLIAVDSSKAFGR